MPDALVRDDGKFALNEQIIRDRVQLVVEHSGQITRELDELCPGHTHALPKQHQLESMDSKFPERLLTFGFTEREALLGHLLCAHDLGRTDLALQKEKGQLAEGRQLHGARSVELMDQIGVFEGFSAEDRFLVAFAIKNHDTLTVPTTAEIETVAKTINPTEFRRLARTARALCYFLRDNDKLEILSETDLYFKEDGALLELKIWHFDRDDRFSELSKHPRFAEIGKKLLREHLFDCPIDAVIEVAHLDLDEQPVALAFIEKMTKPENGPAIEPENWERFLKCQSCKKENITYSYPTYMLYAVAFAFDLRFPSSIEELLDRKLLDPWLNFLKKKLPEADYQIVRQTIASFCRGKLTRLNRDPIEFELP